MQISLLKERGQAECRVALTPQGVSSLTDAGHEVFVEAEAGLDIGYSDLDYQRAGATMVWSPDEAWKRADLVVKVERPTLAELQLASESAFLACFLHPAAAPLEALKLMAEKGLTAMAFEELRLNGEHPILTAMSEIAGRLCPQLAARLLEAGDEGRGVLLSGVPGIPPAEVLILGAGTAGLNAAQAFLGVGAQVTVLDNQPAALRRAEALLGRRPRLVLAERVALWRSVAYADVLVGAVHQSLERAPLVITSEMVQSMKPGSVIIDLAIDEGGCVETSRPTTRDEPAYLAHGIIHCCLPNVTVLAARTASKVLSQTLAPLIREIPTEPSRDDRARHPLGESAVMVAGRPVRQVVADRLEVECADADEMIEGVWL